MGHSVNEKYAIMKRKREVMTKRPKRKAAEEYSMSGLNKTR